MDGKGALHAHPVRRLADREHLAAAAATPPAAKCPARRPPALARPFLGAARRAPHALAQVVELRPAPPPARDHLDAADAWRMDGKGAPPPPPVRRLGDREHLAAAAATP